MKLFEDRQRKEGTLVISADCHGAIAYTVVQASQSLTLSPRNCLLGNLSLPILGDGWLTII